MEYLRHLGVSPAPALGRRRGGSPTGVAADADGWVYLNLLCNLAQLHIFNVAPSFVRAAVAEKSSKFELSSDGRKIRWKGGTKGTSLSSESSTLESTEGDEGDSSAEGSRKRRRVKSAGDSGDGLSSGRQLSGAESFHYKPLFARGGSPEKQSIQGESSASSRYSGEESYDSVSGFENSGSWSSQRRKRRPNGAIIYYSGAPFCTDLSGDPACHSPTTYMVSSGQENQSSEEEAAAENASAASAPLLPYRPLSITEPKWKEVDYGSGGMMDTSSDAAPEEGEKTSDAEIKAEFPWSDARQVNVLNHFEPCGLGGVVPDDHFVMMVTTRRPKEEGGLGMPAPKGQRPQESIAEIAERIASRAAGNSPKRAGSPDLEIEYVSGRIKRLRPTELPPPVTFFPPFSSSDESSDWGNGAESEADDEVSSLLRAPSSRRVHPHESDKSASVGALSDDEGEAEVADGGESPLVDDDEVMGGAAPILGPAVVPRRPGVGGDGLVRRGSLAATAGGASSGYSTSKEGSS